MDIRDRDVWLLEAKRIGAVRQLSRIEAACFPYKEDQRTRLDELHEAASGVEPKSQEDLEAERASEQEQNRALLRAMLIGGRRK